MLRVLRNAVIPEIKYSEKAKNSAKLLLCNFSFGLNYCFAAVKTAALLCLSLEITLIDINPNLAFVAYQKAPLV